MRCRSDVKFKTAAHRNDIRIVPSQFGDAMFRGERRYVGGAANPRAACDGNHDCGLLLALFRLFDGETRAARNRCEDVEEVDGLHGIEEHLAIAFG